MKNYNFIDKEYSDVSVSEIGITMSCQILYVCADFIIIFFLVMFM